MDKKIRVEVAYALPDQQKIVTLHVLPETSMYDAAKASGLEQVFSEINFDQIDMGIFGKVVKDPKARLVHDGDRIELYRPLQIDPKQARLNRAAKKV